MQPSRLFRRKPFSMPLIDQYAVEWASYLRTLSDADLLRTACDYVRLAEFGPVEVALRSP